jgi:hypothetical protein
MKLKRQVVRPMGHWTEVGCQALHSLQVRELLGIISRGAKLQRQGSETSCLACC